MTGKRCYECKYLSDKRCSIGRLCTADKPWRTDCSRWKAQSGSACKFFEPNGLKWEDHMKAMKIDGEQLITALKFWMPQFPEEKDEDGKVVVKSFYDMGFRDGLELAIELVKKQFGGEELY